MEFELQPSGRASVLSGRAGIPVAGMSALLDAPKLDSRHGLIRAAAQALSQLEAGAAAQRSRRRRNAAALRVGRHRSLAAPGGSAVPAHATPSAPLRHSSPRHRVARSPSRAAAGPAPASVTVAAGGAVKEATAAALHSARSAAGARPLQQLVAGGVAGAVSKTLVAPLERVSTMLMTDGRRGFGLGDAVAHAWRDGGLAGLFRGNAATLAKIVPASALQFFVFHGLKDAILQGRAGGSAPSSGGTARGAAAAAAGARPGQEVELSNAERFLAGAAAGAASVSFTYPLESARTLMSVAGGMEGSLVSVCRSVVARGGVGALYRGFQATLLGDVLGNALGFTFYEMGNRLYKDWNGGSAAPPSIRGVIGALSASCTMTLTMPLEVVRRRLQVQGTLGRPVLYRGTLDCIRQVARQEGMRGFYRAALPSYLKVAPSIGAMYFLYEVLTRHMDALAGPAGSAHSSAHSSSSSLGGGSSGRHAHVPASQGSS